MVAQNQTKKDDLEIEAVALKLLNYCRSKNWAGYDPYDALNSDLFKAFPFLDSRFPRLALTQLLKRSPINVRSLLRIAPTQNPKGLAIILKAVIKLSGLGLVEEELVRQLAEKVVAARSPDFSYVAWGYSFPWQTRTIIVPRGAPNLVCTTFTADALLDAFDQTGDTKYLDAATSAADYIVKELYWEEGDVRSFNYPLKTSRSRIHNANLLAAALLCRIHKLAGNDQFLGIALKAARYSASKQHPDGSWPYGELEVQSWIDNFHTGYNLCALDDIVRITGSSEFEPAIQQGYSFYCKHFFRQDGAANYFHNKTYPIDAHAVAQSIITPVQLDRYKPGSIELAEKAARWAISNMWDHRGFFYYRVLPFFRVKTSYMRWTQAWMLLSLATLLQKKKLVGSSDRAALPEVLPT
jgi:hypothetical protein